MLERLCGCQDEAPEEWEPRRGWTDFNPHATMVLHLGLTDNASPHRFTAEQMRTMTQGQFVALLRCSGCMRRPVHRHCRPACKIDRI